MKSVLAIACILLAASAAHGSRRVLGNRQAHPAEWTKGIRADPTTPMKFMVAMRQSNLDVFNERFNAITDPTSPLYGQYMTTKEIRDMVATPKEEAKDVLTWLESEGDVVCGSLGDAFSCAGRAGALERIFNTEFYQFTHVMTGKRIVRQYGEFSVPEKLSKTVELVTGLSGFPVPRLGVVEKINASEITPDYVVVPETISNFYGLSGATGSSKSIQAVAEFQGEPAYADSDLTTFIQEAGVPSFTVAKKVGPFDPYSPQAESTLDIEYVGAVGVGNTNWYWTENDWMYEFTQNVLSATSVPDIISMSYGWSEADQCQISPSICQQLGVDSTGFVTRVNTEFQKVGALGITLLASSGDAGSHGRTDLSCSSPTVHPTYPAASPYVLAVGATQIQNGQSQGAKAPICSELQCATGGVEIVSSTSTGALITSGGGFSNVASQPSYQSTAVNAFLSGSGLRPPSGDFNSGGRGYPDVSALGHKYYIELYGEAYTVDGTSCSSPVFAGILGLINAYLAENGKAKLGFVNPLLYQMYAADSSTFTDVTVGDNKCTQNGGSCCSTGFGATQGWDPVSGLGTPNYQKMLAYVKNMHGIENEPSAEILNNFRTFLRGSQ